MSTRKQFSGELFLEDLAPHNRHRSENRHDKRWIYTGANILRVGQSCFGVKTSLKGGLESRGALPPNILAAGECFRGVSCSWWEQLAEPAVALSVHPSLIQVS